jgi:hypothetical protein
MSILQPVGAPKMEQKRLLPAPYPLNISHQNVRASELEEKLASKA